MHTHIENKLIINKYNTTKINNNNYLVNLKLAQYTQYICYLPKYFPVKISNCDDFFDYSMQIYRQRTFEN